MKNSLTFIKGSKRIFKSPASFRLPLSLSKGPDVFNNALTSIQRPGRLYSYHSLFKGPDVFKIKDVFKNALTFIKSPGRVFKCPDVFTATCLSLKARTCLKSRKCLKKLLRLLKGKEVFIKARTSLQLPLSLFKGPDVFKKQGRNK